MYGDIFVDGAAIFCMFFSLIMVVFAVILLCFPFVMVWFTWILLAGSVLLFMVSVGWLFFNR